MLAEDEHEQKDDEMYQLLVAQRQLDCQFQHGISPVYAGSAANWLGLAICYTPLLGVALGLPRMAFERRLWLVFGSNDRAFAVIAARRVQVTTPYTFRTFSGLLGRNRGVVAPRNRYPARGSARVTFLKHNDETHWRKWSAAEFASSGANC